MRADEAGEPPDAGRPAGADAALERYRALLDNAEDIIYTHDFTRLTSVNRAAERLTGYLREELVGMALADLLTPESLAYSLRMGTPKVGGAVATTTYELEVVTKDGRKLPLEISSWLIVRDGVAVGVEGIGRDISRRRETERALRESEARFRLLADHAHDYIYRFELRPERRFSYVSPAATRMFGYTPEEFYADPDLPLKLALPEDRHLTSSAIRGERVPEAVTIRVRRKDGRLIWVEFLRVPVYDQDGALVAVESVGRDVTERRRAAEAAALLARAGRLLAETLDEEALLARLARLAVPALADWCAVDLVGPDGATRGLGGAHVDPAREPLIAELQHRYPPDPAAGQPASRVLGSGRAVLLAAVAPAELAATSRDEGHLALRRALGFASVMVVPLRARSRMLGMLTLAAGEGRPCYDRADLALAEELAGRAALAVDNARLYREAQQAVRVRDEFLSIAAHELKTPVTSLRGFAQLLRRRLGRGRAVEPELLERSLATIDQQAETLARLVGQLLDVGRLEGGRLRLERAPADVAALARRAVAAAQATTQRHTIALVAPEAATAEVDAPRLDQVLTNLLDNAIKYSPRGGPIEVALELPAADTLRLAVTDRGTGVAPEHRERIFDRFYRAEGGERAGGMGLGLFLSRQIVELHGGRLTLEAPAGGGSRFVVTLPRGDEAKRG